MTTDDAPRTPLTLEFAPETLEGDEVSVPVAVLEPSFQHPGRIFIGIHPYGTRLGLHLLPQDAKKVRDHLSKLLLEPGETGLPEDYEPPERPPVDWQARIKAAAQKAKKPKKPSHFRFEAQVGRFVIVVGTTHDA